nr:hypothetical protein [Tanacetum cinerariifolium]
MLCYLAGMEPYYLKCIKDGPFQPKTAEDDAKSKSQWTPDERRVVVQDQRLKSIIMSCLPYDIMVSVISCVSAKETWTDLVHSFEGPSNTKENRIMDLKLEYQTFRAKSTESLSQTFTRYKTLLNELANDGVNFSKHKIIVGFINSLPEKWLTFSQGLRNANNTQTLDIADIYGRFVYEDNLIQKRSSEEYLRDLDVEYQEKSLLANSKRFIKRRNNFSGQKANENTKCYKCGNKGHFARDCFSKMSNPSYQSLVNNFSLVSKGFQPKFTPKLIQSSPNSNSQTNLKFQKDYKAEYKKIKAKLALLKASPSSPQEPKTFQPKNKGLFVKIFDWDEEEVSDDEDVTQVKVLMAIADDELTIEKSHAQNEMVPKTKDWERLNPNSKLSNFNTERILVPESQVVNESLESLNAPKSSKDFEAEFLTPLPPLKNLQGASLRSECLLLELPQPGTTSTEQPHLKDKSMWSDQEKRIQKIDRLARSLLIQGLPNDIYSLIDSNKTAKDLWDALATHMLGLEYGKQDRKAAVLYEYETFKATEGELLLDTYIRYLQVINDLKKCVYSKDNCELNFVSLEKSNKNVTGLRYIISLIGLVL